MSSFGPKIASSGTGSRYAGGRHGCRDLSPARLRWQVTTTIIRRLTISPRTTGHSARQRQSAMVSPSLMGGRYHRERKQNRPHSDLRFASALVTATRQK